MENYEKKYKEAMERMKLCVRSGLKITPEYIFTELKESEDEKVRKELIDFIKTWKEKSIDFTSSKALWTSDEEKCNKYLAWLEKQAERKTPQWMIDFLDGYRRKIGCSLDHDEARDVEGKILCITQWLEKQGQVKESTISQHEIETCKENNNSLTSEDKKVRQALLEMVHDTTGDELWVDYNVHKEEALDWLERQGEQIDIANKEYWRGYREGKKLILDKYAEIEKPGKQFAGYTTIVETGDGGINALVTRELPTDSEQKPADKVESHFHVEKGKWYMCIKNNVGITKGNAYYGISDGYIIDDNGRKYNCKNWSVFQGYLRLWDITIDAKNGDVLKEDSCIFILEKIKSQDTAITHYCLFDDGDFNLSSKICFDVDSTYPATKEQRDTLLKAMADTGYTFDFENKKLKKTEPKSKENKGNIG